MDSKNKEHAEALVYQSCCDLYGKKVAIDIVLRGKQPTPRFSGLISNPRPYSDAEDPAYAKRKARVLQNLNPLEQRTFLLIHEDGCTIAEVARRENVKRQAIYSRIQRMIRKSKYCRVSAEVGRLSRKTNQHG
jgi:DNA-directed RNA polymerase specialized sigma24 family protein